jgi:hypothetical protein
MTGPGPVDGAPDPPTPPMTDTDGTPEPAAPPPSDGAGGTDPHPPPPPVPTPDSRTVRFAWVAVAVILIGVVALVTYALTDATPAQQVAHPPATPTGTLAQLASVPLATFDEVGITTTPPTTLEAPTVLKGQPPLLARGRPEVLFVGAEFCPFCAAERWPLVVALSRFGRFTRLYDTVSSPASVFPGIQTFTFTGSVYSSRYVTLTGVELFSNGTDADGSFARIATLTPAQQSLVDRYRGTAPVGTLGSDYPFVDVGNILATATSAFSPTLLVHQSQAAIVGDLTQPQNPAGQAIVAASNQLTAGICDATGQRPTRVCTSKGVRSAALALGLP